TMVANPTQCLRSWTSRTSLSGIETWVRPVRSDGQIKRCVVSTSEMETPQSLAVRTTNSSSPSWSPPGSGTSASDGGRGEVLCAWAKFAWRRASRSGRSAIAQGDTFSIWLAPSAAAATPSRSLSIEASTAAITAPSTKGALLSSTRPSPTGNCSIAIWVLSTALPRSTSTSTPSGPRTSSIAPRIAVASVPSRPSAVPPATAIFTRPWVICAASSRTPSASCRLCETRTRLTVPIGPRQDVDWMRRVRPGAMLDLHPAGLTIGQHGVGPRGFDGGEEPAADLHREIVLLDLDAARARDATASFIDFFELHHGDQAKQAHRRVADAVRLQVAGSVIQEPRRDGLKVKVELAGLVQHPEVLADVVNAGSHLLGAGNVEQVRVIVLQH